MVEEIVGSGGVSGRAGSGEGGDERNGTVSGGEAALEVEERGEGFGESGEEMGRGRGLGSEEGEFLELSVVRSE